MLWNLLIFLGTLMNESSGNLYLCVDHVGPFQMAMKSMGRTLCKPRLVIGEEKVCDVCGARNGPSFRDPFLFRVAIRPPFDQELIDFEWMLLERLQTEGLSLQEAMRVVEEIEKEHYGVLE